MSKPEKDPTNEEIYMPISPVNADLKSSTKYQQFESNNTLKRSYTMIKWDSSQG